MKKILVGLSVVLGTLVFAQYQNNGWGNNGGYYENNNGYNNNGYYDDDVYFPDDYYYDYPNDYYEDNYYQSYYNDYRNSIVAVNWNQFFRRYRLTSWQIQQIMMLNDMHASFSSWNSYYRYNPDRWYYDRFYNLRRILGPQVFIVFQNNYYRGYDPIVYFQNYRRDFYAPRFRVAPRYVNVNVNIFRIDRNRFYDTHGNKYGWNQTRNPHNPGGFREGRNIGNGGFANVRNENGVRNQNNGSGFRNQNETRNQNNSGFRSENNENGTRSIRNNGTRANQSTDATPRSNNGIRNTGPQRNESPRTVERTPTSPRSNEGFRNNSGNQRSASPRIENKQRSNSENTSGNRGNGTRTRLISN